MLPHYTAGVNRLGVYIWKAWLDGARRFQYLLMIYKWICYLMCKTQPQYILAKLHKSFFKSSNKKILILWMIVYVVNVLGNYNQNKVYYDDSQIFMTNILPSLLCNAENDNDIYLKCYGS